ncbi:MAG: polyhydroxyalkanoic acid system family protein [Polyangiales bacterium]|nr:polyhydroxyalkanoic acid system family protein [Myxococcales bacterium]
MKHVVKHDLDHEVAKRATDKAFAAYRERFAKYNPDFQWVDDKKGTVSFEAKGVKIKGGLELKPGAIEMDLEVPFLLRPFTGKAMEVIDSEFRKWIAKAKAGEV